MSRPIIQYPQDIVATQELIWSIEPDLVFGTGIAHGGSLIFYASMLELNAGCGGPQDAAVLGIGRDAIESHPMMKRIEMIEGSSVSANIIDKANEKAAGKRKILVCMDSDHTCSHVLAELWAYAPLATVGSYRAVFDTVVDDLPAKEFAERPWRPGNNRRLH